MTKMPKPARMTVLAPKNEGLYARPTRGLNIVEVKLENLVLLGLLKVKPPSTLKFATGSVGLGLAAYAVVAAAL
jgi:hypothetical protein